MADADKESVTQERKFQIKGLSLRHERVCLLLVQGKKVKDVARETGFCREIIFVIAHSRAGRKYINRLCGQRDREATEAYREMMWGALRFSKQRKKHSFAGVAGRR